jgi:hypothetical protein
MKSAQATQSREIRVFLSSTFKDMDAERNYLVKQVFPRVRAACLARQVGFTEIDLRWGVTEEESQNGATVEICLKEIDRCRDFPPFFIGFLGSIEHCTVDDPLDGFGQFDDLRCRGIAQQTAGTSGNLTQRYERDTRNRTGQWVELVELPTVAHRRLHASARF